MKKSLLATLAAVGVSSAVACSVVVVGKDASATGRVLVGHNEDDSGELFVRNGLVPAGDHAVGETMPAEKGCAAVPQVAHTCGFYWSEVKGLGGGPSNADAFFNEHGVFVVSDNAAAEPFDDAHTALTDGGIYYNLRRAIAERAKSAREAVDVATNLIARWGYAAPRGRIYTVADRDEAWTIQVLKGRRVVARKCPDDQVAVVPNCLTVRELRPGDVVSPCVAEEAAKAKGYDYALRFQGAKRWRDRTDTLRMKHLYRLAAGVNVQDDYPYSVKPAHKVSPADLKAALSTHYEGTPDEMQPLRHGSESATRYLPVCRQQTIESCVCEFGGTVAETALHVASGSPCEHPYRTFRPYGEGIPAALDRSADAAERLSRHFRPMSPEEYFAELARLSPADGVGRFPLEGVGASVFYDAPAPLGQGSPCEVAVVLAHGWGGGLERAAEQAPMMRALAKATPEGKTPPYVVAPLFPRADLVQKHGFESRGLARWNASWRKDLGIPCKAEDDWRGGGDAVGTSVSSYDVVDRIFATLADRTLYPNLKRVVLTGFSAGGQFAGRYAAVGRGKVRDGVELAYAAMAPSSELRFEPEVKWHYGLKGRPRYSAALTEQEIRTNLCSRRVWRACGTQDVLSKPYTSLDLSAEAMAQGTNRYMRFRSFERYLRQYPDWAKNVTFHALEGVGHNTVAAHSDPAFVRFVLAGNSDARPRKKLVAHGWDLLAAQTEDVWRNRAKFAASGVDGILMPVDGRRPDGKTVFGRNVMLPPRWSDADFAVTRRQLKEMTCCEGLRESYGLVFWTPRERLAWTDDAAWETFAANFAVFARTARAGGLKGVAIDHEDYSRTKQFKRVEGDPEIQTAAELARARGRQVFEAFYREFPEATVLAFWMFSEARDSALSTDPMSVNLARGDLWTSFLNGMLDVMPATGRFVDGSESFGYHADAAKDDFRRGAWDMIRGVVPLVAPENRAKYATGLSVSFGQYLDMYINKEGSHYYFGPRNGSRLARFAENLAGAVRAADDCIWLYGEKGTWIDWDRKATKNMKYPTWETLLPGLAKMLRGTVGAPSVSDAGMTNLLGAASEILPFKPGEAIKPFGRWTSLKDPPKDLFTYEPALGYRKPGCLKLVGNGCFTAHAGGLNTGDRIVVRLAVRGPRPVVNAAWQQKGAWKWDLGCNYLTSPAGTAPDAWAELSLSLTVPEGADGIGLTMGGAATAEAPVYFDDVRILREADMSETPSK